MRTPTKRSDHHGREEEDPGPYAVQRQGEDDLPKIGAPARRALAAAGVTSLEQVAAWTEADLKKLHGMGPNALGKLRDALAERGFSFRSA